MTGPADKIELKRALAVAVRAARAGGEVAKARLGDAGYLKWKGERDVVPEATFRVQDAIVSTILAEFPGAGILAEEGPEDAPLPLDAAHLWIIDPICGSLNFAQGIPHFAISIALRSEGNIRVGVVYDPCADELFEATTETPATLNGKNIFVQQISEGTEAWASAIVGTDWPRSGERREQARIIVGFMMAAGRLHAYWHLDLKIWDIAAANLILQRAGGILTDEKGMSWLFSEGGYIATNGVIHGWALNCIQPFLTQPRFASGSPEPRSP
ncbi:MAG: hypothetical protein HW398_1325 [Acidobacteria bacterium]|nr:hypothetical protein [Acidobacteriota bacterium]